MSNVLNTGWGKPIAASTTPEEIIWSDGLRANLVSVYNNSGQTAYALVGVDGTELAARVAAGTAVVIPNGATFTFDCQSRSSISEVAVVLAAGSGEVIVNAF